MTRSFMTRDGTAEPGPRHPLATVAAVSEPGRWTVEQVAAIAPNPATVVAAESLAVGTRWAGTGADGRVVWGRCSGSGTEPYDTSVDHVGVAWRCTCPSRRRPCKHAVALLLMWARGQVPVAVPPRPVAEWAERQIESAAAEADASRRRGAGDVSGDASSGGDGGHHDVDGASPPGRDDLDRSRDERVARMLEGLDDLDRWLVDRVRNGLADPALARYATWDDLAARLVDARAGALANRVRRLAGLVGAQPDWQADVLAELGILHLLARAGRRVGELPETLADSVAAASGWQVRQADVLAGVPDTDDWVVLGRSDRREDRIEVRRVWLRGASKGRWALLLSFAAYGQSLDTSLVVGSTVHADIHRYPGSGLRALMGRRWDDPLPTSEVRSSTIGEACAAIGAALAAEPWLERVPATIVAQPSILDGRWVLGDDAGSLPLLGDDRSLAALLAASVGSPITITVEWTPAGLLPLTVHLDDRSLDVGPRADASFVGVS